MFNWNVITVTPFGVGDFPDAIERVEFSVSSDKGPPATDAICLGYPMTSEVRDPETGKTKIVEPEYLTAASSADDIIAAVKLALGGGVRRCESNAVAQIKNERIERDAREADALKVASAIAARE